jgi:hypothetical protein
MFRTLYLNREVLGSVLAPEAGRFKFPWLSIVYEDMQGYGILKCVTVAFFYFISFQLIRHTATHIMEKAP